jgi:uncharacterized protein
LKTIFVTMILFFATIGMAGDNVKILIITGGHGFEQPQFYKMFDDLEGVSWDSLSHPKANDIYSSQEIDNYDVLVYYDMNQQITPEQKKAFLNVTNKGKGFLFLHHSLASYQDWDEFLQIQGGRYHLEPVDKSKASTFKHDVDLNVKIADSNHPVVRGINDFTIHDEAYGNFEVLPDSHPLLKTSHPESSEIIGWTNDYGASRVVYLQLGHDHFAYENANYAKLVRNSIMWLAEKDE